MVERGPEKAGVGSSILLLGINERLTYEHDSVSKSMREFIPADAS